MIELLAEILRMIAPKAASAFTAAGGEIITNYDELANETYNQRTTTGLAAQVKLAQDRVASGVINLESPELTRKFLKQSPSVAAANLCNTVTRFLHISPNGDFGKFYTEGVKNDCYKWTGIPGRLAYLKNPTKLMQGYVIQDYMTYNLSTDQIFEILDNAPKTALVRNRRNTHTFLIYNEGGAWFCADTWHNQWTGKRLADRLNGQAPKYVYWYKKE